MDTIWDHDAADAKARADYIATRYYFDVFSDGDHPSMVEERPSVRRCRFCGRDETAVTFKKKAHAVSEALGNKHLLSYRECDACNAFFGQAYEDALVKYIGALRTFMMVLGKNGVPSYKSPDGKMRIDVKDGHTVVRIRAEKDEIPSFRPDGGALVFHTATDKGVTIWYRYPSMKVDQTVYPEMWSSALVSPTDLMNRVRDYCQNSLQQEIEWIHQITGGTGDLPSCTVREKEICSLLGQIQTELPQELSQHA